MKTALRNQPPSPRTPHAFTLIELLVVISVIALLIAILMPALTSAREAARTSVCGSTSRQIGVAFYAYETDNKTLPPGFVQYTPAYRDWTFIVPDGYMPDRDSANVLKCASTDAAGPNDYSVHPRLMPDIRGSYDTVAIDMIENPTELILMGDGVIQPSNQTAEPTLAAIAGWRATWGRPNEWHGLVFRGWEGFDWDDTCPSGVNADSSSNRSQPRFRHGGDLAANFLFLDGHVESRAQQDLLIRNVMLRSSP